MIIFVTRVAFTVLRWATSRGVNRVSSVKVVPLKALRRRCCDEQDKIICDFISLSMSANSHVVAN